jgi:RecB family exonuclease
MQCPKQFYFQTILKLPSPPTLAQMQGTVAHTVFERIFDLPPAERTPERALAFVDPAFDVLLHPVVERSTVEPGSPEDAVRDGAEGYTDLAAPDSWTVKRAAKDAVAYAELFATEADQDALKANVRGFVTNWFTMEDPTVFTPEARELHVAAQVLGVPLHGYIDRLDKVTHEGREYWYVSDYKGLALDTPLVTPDGWTTMGEVAVGDQVFGADGRACTVIGKSEVHDRPCYEITFDDNSSIVCDNVHLWSVQTPKSPAGSRDWEEEVLDADALFSRFEAGERPIAVANAQHLLTADTDLPLDPYLLGCWLGDGITKSGTLCAGTRDVEHFVAALTTLGERVVDSSSTSDLAKGDHLLSVLEPRAGRCVRDHTPEQWRSRTNGSRRCTACERQDSGKRPTNTTLGRRLSAIGVLHNKHVPAIYLRASVAQRLDLLRGLMDTDGYWDKGRQQAVFSNTNRRLIDAVYELVCSLGGRAYVFAVPRQSERHSQAWQVIFTPHGFNPFRLERKAADVRLGTSRSWRRVIRSIEIVESVPTQCIMVDSSDSLYLAGRQMVPTHNTGKVPSERFLADNFFGLEVYAVLIRALHGVVPHELRLVYVKETGKQSIKTLQPTAAHLDTVEKKLRAVWAGIKRAAQTETWPTKTGPLCPWCDYKDICPAFHPELEGMLPEEREPDPVAG